MVTQVAAHRNLHEGMRPFDIQRDLPQLADLIELTFQAELEQTGNPIAAELRRLARAGPLLWLLGAFTTAVPLIRGYVWIANGQLVGNVTLNVESRRRRLWSISNVAVHPDFRGHGIARQLLETALQEARNKGAQLIVLQVEKGNVPAQHLYSSLGFQVYDTIAELRLPVHKWVQRTVLPALPLRKRRPADWQGLYMLSRAATPLKAQKVTPILAHHYRLGIGRRLGRWIDSFLFLRHHSEWVLEEDNKIIAWLQITGRRTRAAHQLQITVHPHHRGAIEEKLVDAGLSWLNRFPSREIMSTVSLSHPEAQQALHNAGFQTVRCLDQMFLELCSGEST